jgi:hypothetical protein
MVVAMVAMRMVQMTVDQIVYMVAVRYRLVTASRPMHMGAVMAAALMAGRAPVGIGRRHLDAMLVDMVAMPMVQVAVMEVVDVVAVTYRRMAAGGTVVVGVILVLGARAGAGAHGGLHG